ncbi:villin headpiece domain containing protein [Nitzschia inconspicua]|uniref:Villin headpiece domain containing protein n=1 Tax=Nitzschia inconspicua TaxID=303405 RepID=A0A9K3K904_9STRA|nr:villin headpiece domain containing protein [Nitzschia inconspicua]KAG7340114.1 villin headpiece domain containing protein [Nitzschia inconspicua]
MTYPPVESPTESTQTGSKLYRKQPKMNKDKNDDDDDSEDTVGILIEYYSSTDDDEAKVGDDFSYYEEEEIIIESEDETAKTEFINCDDDDDDDNDDLYEEITVGDDEEWLIDGAQEESMVWKPDGRKDDSNINDDVDGEVENYTSVNDRIAAAGNVDDSLCDDSSIAIVSVDSSHFFQDDETDSDPVMHSKWLDTMQTAMTEGAKKAMMEQLARENVRREVAARQQEKRRLLQLETAKLRASLPEDAKRFVISNKNESECGSNSVSTAILQEAQQYNETAARDEDTTDSTTPAPVDTGNPKMAFSKLRRQAVPNELTGSNLQLEATEPTQPCTTVSPQQSSPSVSRSRKIISPIINMNMKSTLISSGSFVQRSEYLSSSGPCPSNGSIEAIDIKKKLTHAPHSTMLKETMHPEQDINRQEAENSIRTGTSIAQRTHEAVISQGCHISKKVDVNLSVNMDRLGIHTSSVAEKDHTKPHSIGDQNKIVVSRINAPGHLDVKLGRLLGTTNGSSRNSMHACDSPNFLSTSSSASKPSCLPISSSFSTSPLSSTTNYVSKRTDNERHPPKMKSKRPGFLQQPIHEVPSMFLAAYQRESNIESKKESSESNVPMMSNEIDTAYYSLEQLQSEDVGGIDIRHRERYLSPSDFQLYFKMSKDEFATLPKWKRDKAKRTLKLF